MRLTARSLEVPKTLASRALNTDVSFLMWRAGRMPGAEGATLSLRGVEQAGVNRSPQTER